MTEIEKGTRGGHLRKVQEKILSLLGEIGNEIDALPKSKEVEYRAQNLQRLIGRFRNSTVSFGELFTDESRPIKSFQKISFNELFEGDGIESLKLNTSGNFGKVLYRGFGGQKVAAMIQKRIDKNEGKEEKSSVSDFNDEISILRVFTHENIISFRGWGEHDGYTYLVMEHLDKNLYDYVKEQSSDKNKGLTPHYTWAIAKQIMQAMRYLHTLDIAIFHGDLGPAKIWLDTEPIIPKPKICDFGFERRDFKDCDDQNEDELQEAKTMKDLLNADVCAYGLVVLFMASGKSPCIEEKANDSEGHMFGMRSQMVRKRGRYYVRNVELPPDLPANVLGDLIRKCCLEPTNRPTFKEIEKEFFGEKVENPFKLSEKGEFFECGFLKDTQIFVADSMVKDTEDETSEPSSYPPGYRSEDLICSVEIEESPYDDPPDDEELRNLYKEHRSNFEKRNPLKCKAPAIALTALVTDRAGDDESQKLKLKFQQKTYCHHQAMREVWKSFNRRQKETLVPCLSEVHPLYSTSFGLHVAILTNEGPGIAKKFVFIKRPNKPDIENPGSYTCGIVESCSTDDFLQSDAREKLVKDPDPELKYISILNTAARGLKDHGLQVKAEEITLNTIYLRYDTHEWGMCGFVDLTSEKIQEENRFSFEKLNSAFTAAQKDKFKDWEIYGVDFELPKMVEWIKNNHDSLEHPAKIVAVKVLQAFLGTAAVVNAFENTKM